MRVDAEGIASRCWISAVQPCRAGPRDRLGWWDHRPITRSRHQAWRPAPMNAVNARSGPSQACVRTECGAGSIWERIHVQNLVNVEPGGISLTVARLSAVANDTEPPIRPRDCSNDAIEP